MPDQRKTGDLYARLILVVLLSVSICEALYTSLFLTDKLSGTIVVFTIPFTLLFSLMFKNRISSLISAIIMVLVLILCTSYVIYLMGIGQGDKFFIYMNWFIDLVNGYPDFSKTSYNMITILLMSFLITLLVFLFTVKFYNFYILCILCLSVFFVQLQFKILNGRLAFTLFVFSFLMLYFYQVLKNRYKKQNYRNGNPIRYLIFVIPFCMLILCIGLLLPVRENRITWTWLDKKADSIITNTSNAINEKFFNADTSAFDYFSLDATGFGKSDYLGGNINLSKKQVMNVCSDFSNVYLKGASKPFYDGHRWYDDMSYTYTPLQSVGDTYSDIENAVGMISFNNITNNKNIAEPTNIDIEYSNIKTKSVFIPAMTTSLTVKKPISLNRNDEFMIFADEMMEKDFSYTVSYSNLNLNSDELKSTLKKSYRRLYHDYIINVFPKLNSETSNSISQYYDKIYSKYTTLPGSITGRTRGLAYQITQNAQTNYDKAKAIETYLSQSYPYTLTPGKTPRNQDFVDYFLFDGKKGYCTYYASAMVVLLRCISIPARYVEGYILPPTSENGVYKVTNQQAHAWVEVYFEGVGWIPFEPTSPFVSNMYKDNSIKPNISSDMTGSSYVDYMDMINQYSNTNKSDMLDDSVIATDVNNKDDKLSLIVVIIYITLITILCVALLYLLLVIYRKIQFRRYLRLIQKSSPNQAVLLLYEYILKVLKLLNLNYKPGETPSDFGKRVEKRLDFVGYTVGKFSFIRINSYFINARYSQIELSQEEKQNMLDFTYILLRLTREKISKTKYFICKYIKGKI